MGRSMNHEGYRVVGLWDTQHYNRIYKILEDVPAEKYLWSALQYRSEDGQTGRSVLVYDEDLAQRIAKVGVAHIFYRIRVGEMPTNEHKAIGRFLFKDKIPVSVSTSYKVDKSIRNAI